MLQQVLSLFQQSGGVPLSIETISTQTGLSSVMVQQMLYTLVQKGRLVEVDEGCRGCEVCPLHVVCAGVPTTPAKGYLLKSRIKQDIEVL
ncbi:MAG: Rrf2 family transcriptional regulator [Anaerolineales bacterium]|nr:Rrf2 family transcriptional regulator [Anaerolineales bacterium]